MHCWTTTLEAERAERIAAYRAAADWLTPNTRTATPHAARASRAWAVRDALRARADQMGQQ
jgi:hypothetical protein